MVSGTRFENEVALVLILRNGFAFSMSDSKPRVVIAGQVPPPLGGQNIMIREALAQFASNPAITVDHLAFFFTPNVSRTRAGSFSKLLELIRVIRRLLCLRSRGPIDLLLYPTGGPQLVPVIRDLALLPWIFCCSRKVVLQFHAAGIGGQFDHGILRRMLRRLYRKAFAAVVMTEFNRRDPEASSIKRILVIPHHIKDELTPSLTARPRDRSHRLLYVGHLCADKGTPALLEAFSSLRQRHPGLTLELVGECLPPFSKGELEDILDRLRIRQCVETPGVLSGYLKQEAFARADLFVFPSVAPYESFGLVLVEAMAWRLPIVATDWRGNRDVMTSEIGGICFPVQSLARDLEGALSDALRRKTEWPQWGRTNRRIFEQRYSDADDRQWLAGPLLSLLVGEKP